MKKLYLSGAISSNPNYKEDFTKAKAILKRAGYKVICPVDFCRESWGWERCMRKCLRELSRADAVAVIPSDYPSRGKRLEVLIAKSMDFGIKTVKDWVCEQ